MVGCIDSVRHEFDLNSRNSEGQGSLIASHGSCKELGS